MYVSRGYIKFQIKLVFPSLSEDRFCLSNNVEPDEIQHHAYLISSALPLFSKIRI